MGAARRLNCGVKRIVGHVWYTTRMQTNGKHEVHAKNFQVVLDSINHETKKGQLLRELVTNTVPPISAALRRGEKGYEPRVALTVDPSPLALVKEPIPRLAVVDNGVSMSAEELYTRLLEVGAPRSEENFNIGARLTARKDSPEGLVYNVLTAYDPVAKTATAHQAWLENQPGQPSVLKVYQGEQKKGGTVRVLSYKEVEDIFPDWVLAAGHGTKVVVVGQSLTDPTAISMNFENVRSDGARWMWLWANARWPEGLFAEDAAGNPTPIRFDAAYPNDGDIKNGIFTGVTRRVEGAERAIVDRLVAAPTDPSGDAYKAMSGDGYSPGGVATETVTLGAQGEYPARPGVEFDVKFLLGDSARVAHDSLHGQLTGKVRVLHRGETYLTAAADWMSQANVNVSSRHHTIHVTVRASGIRAGGEVAGVGVRPAIHRAGLLWTDGEGHVEKRVGEVVATAYRLLPDDFRGQWDARANSLLPGAKGADDKAVHRFADFAQEFRDALTEEMRGTGIEVTGESGGIRIQVGRAKSKRRRTNPPSAPAAGGRRGGRRKPPAGEGAGRQFFGIDEVVRITAEQAAEGDDVFARLVFAADSTSARLFLREDDDLFVKPKDYFLGLVRRGEYSEALRDEIDEFVALAITNVYRDYLLGLQLGADFEDLGQARTVLEAACTPEVLAALATPKLALTDAVKSKISKYRVRSKRLTAVAP